MGMGIEVPHRPVPFFPGGGWGMDDGAEGRQWNAAGLRSTTPTEQAKHAAKIIGGGLHDPDLRISIFDPADWDLIDPESVPPRLHDQLGVKKPPVVFDRRQQRLRHRAAHRFEATLGVAYRVAERRHGSARCRTGRSPPAGIHDAPGPPGPTGSRSRRRLFRRPMGRSTTGATQVRSTGPRPCTPPHRLSWSTRPFLGLHRGLAAPDVWPGSARPTAANCSTIPQVPSVLPLSTTVMVHR